MSPASGRAGGLSLEDCNCPVCLEIFIEPVTLPCTHTFCKVCFLESVDKATLCCPLCRKRVSTWARLHSRNNTLINQQLWAGIQTTFPLQCQRRLSGQDATEDPAVFFPRVSQPGELRQEYENQLTKLTEEKRAFDEEERKASEELIQRLLAEEQELLQEERRRREGDERLAKLLSDQLNAAVVPRENPRPPDVTPSKKKKKKEEAVPAGQIERFLSPRPSQSSSTANKENILVSLIAHRSPPQLDYYGAGSAEPDLHPASPAASVEDPPHQIRDAGPSSVKRKSSELEEEETQQVCHSPPPSCSSLQGRGCVQEVNEMELLKKHQQEEEDRRLALLLQKELDQEEKQKATDRRKGSSDAYPLRQKHKQQEEEEVTGVDPPSRRRSAPSVKTTRTSSSAPSVKATRTSCSAPSVKATRTSSSAPSVKATRTSSPAPSTSSRGTKQTTLTEMFSSLSG